MVNTIVVTTINPYTKVAQQKLCFEKWKLVGYEILSFNSMGEYKVLLEAGFKESDIVVIDSSETALDLFGKQIPRIIPVLNRVVSLDYDNYLLVNADIYPVHRKPVSTFLQAIDDNVALTRNECAYLTSHSYADSSPYRGGLDIFFFTSVGLSKTFKKLLSNSVSERMTFGIPGWDYYLGHTILQSGGTIMDGEVFLHQSHPTSYNNIEEFQCFADKMHESGGFRQAETNAIASEFAERINKNCKDNWQLSQLLKKIFYQKPALDKSELQQEKVCKIEQQLLSALANENINFHCSNDFRWFICSQLEGVSWVAAESFRKDKLNQLPIIQSSFILLLTQILVKKNSGTLSISRQYPLNSMHGIALRQIIENAQGVERLHLLLGLFATDLGEHSIFNVELFKYFILDSKSKSTLAICAAILHCVVKETHV